jgi:hypothetical protein
MPWPTGDAAPRLGFVGHAAQRSGVILNEAMSS